MARQKTQLYKIAPAWRITQTDGRLLVSGGADARYEVEWGLDRQSFFASERAGCSFSRDELGADDQRVLEQLITAEIVVPVLSTQTNKGIRIRIFGDGGLDNIGSKRVKVTEGRGYDVGLIVRRTSTYAELLDRLNYGSIAIPHLFVDMAFHHTISIGPLVFPGETACIACLQGRLTTRWGDDMPPLAPAANSRYIDLAAQLVAMELARIAEGDTSLVNNTCAWNIQDRVAKMNLLLKVPLCPVCAQNVIDRDGALALPWG